MNNYNLIIKIALMTLPFRHYQFIKEDYYYQYRIKNIKILFMQCSILLILSFILEI